MLAIMAEVLCKILNWACVKDDDIFFLLLPTPHLGYLGPLYIKSL